MKKLIATLILGLSVSGAALADDGYFADYVGDFSNAPVENVHYSDSVLDNGGWSYRMIVIPTAESEGIVSIENENEWMQSSG